jgi:hypothetical protein
MGPAARPKQGSLMGSLKEESGEVTGKLRLKFKFSQKGWSQKI